VNPNSEHRARTIATMLACTAGGAAMAAAFLVSRGDAVAPPASAPMPQAAPIVVASSPPANGGAGDLAAVHTKLDAMQATLRALDAKVDDALTARAPAGVDAAVVTIDPAVLEAAMQRAIVEAEAEAKRVKVAEMQPREVVREAADLVNANRDIAGARGLLEALLQRQLTPEERCDAMVQLGIVHRAAGDHRAAKAALQGVIDEAGGVGTKAGARAAFQMAWTHEGASERASAHQWFEQVARSAGADPALRVEGRWNAARFGDESDPGVRAELESLLRETDGNEQFRHIAQAVKQRLARR
jgi:hypothetical protein